MTESRQAVVYLALVFLLGASLGAGGYHWYDSSREALADATKKDDAKEESAVDWLAAELECTKWQKEQLEGILDATYQQYDQIFEELSPRYEEARQRGRDRIREILSDEQVKRFDKLVRRIDAKEKKKKAKSEK